MLPAKKEIPGNTEKKPDPPGVSQQPSTVSVGSELPPPTSVRPKSTLNLGSILKPKEKLAVAGITPLDEPQPVRPLTDEQLRKAWADYADSRKNQVAEFHLLSRQVDIKGSVVTVALANSVEEPLLQAILPGLLAHLRSRLSNSTIKVESILQKEETKKIAYTNKEKFDLLAEKNPLLKELKDRLWLDPDF